MFASRQCKNRWNIYEVVWNAMMSVLNNVLPTCAIVNLRNHRVLLEISLFTVSPYRRNIQLSVVKVNEINIPPRENVAYSKETQTINPEPLDKDGK